MAAAQTWKFRPFGLAGQAIPVCSMMRLAYPAGLAPAVERLPLPLPPSRSRREPFVLTPGAKLLEGRRIAGEKLVVPDDRGELALQKRGIHRVDGTSRLCIDETGKIESVVPVRSTGLASYDRRILAAIQRWVYQPYMIDDAPVPVCTAVTFIYRQR